MFSLSSDGPIGNTLELVEARGPIVGVWSLRRRDGAILDVIDRTAKTVSLEDKSGVHNTVSHVVILHCEYDPRKADTETNILNDGLQIVARRVSSTCSTTEPRLKSRCIWPRNTPSTRIMLLRGTS